MRSPRLTILFGLIILLNAGIAMAGRRQPEDPDPDPETTPAAIAARDEQMTLAGQILPVLKRLAINGDKARDVLNAMNDAVSLEEFFLISVVGWAWFPLSRAIFTIVQNSKSQQPEPVEEDDETDATDLGLQATHGKVFEDTFWYQSALHMSQAAKIGAFVYAVDCFAVALNTLGFKYKQQAGFSKKAANVSFSVWIALRIGALKKYLLRKAFHKERNEMGKVRVYNGILNVVLTVATFGHVLDLFDIDFGLAITSLLSLGGVGTLVFSLASKDLATELVSGLVVSASDRFLTGDKIEMGDGTAGYISSMGILNTDVRGNDEVVTRIPNSQLASQRTRNLSRAAPRSQVKQTLRFSYEDISKMPAILDAIKEEIRISCPELIDDGSRPFRAHWRNFKDDHLEVVVDTHFNIKPTGDVYWDNRQKVLEAIARATEKNGVDFTLPSQICK